MDGSSAVHGLTFSRCRGAGDGLEVDVHFDRMVELYESPIEGTAVSMVSFVRDGVGSVRRRVFRMARWIPEGFLLPGFLFDGARLGGKRRREVAATHDEVRSRRSTGAAGGPLDLERFRFRC